MRSTAGGSGSHDCLYRRTDPPRIGRYKRCGSPEGERGAGVKLTAETSIRCDLETIWRLTQTPEQHVRWDARFTEIKYLPRASPDVPQRFRYATRIGFGKSIEGWGETVGEQDGRASALRFGSDDPKSLIGE